MYEINKSNFYYDILVKYFKIEKASLNITNYNIK